MDFSDNYNGVGGVFYTPKHDDIFIIEWSGDGIIHNNNTRSKLYYYWCGVDSDGKVKLVVSGMEDCVKLGDL